MLPAYRFYCAKEIPDGRLVTKYFLLFMQQHLSKIKNTFLVHKRNIASNSPTLHDNFSIVSGHELGKVNNGLLYFIVTAGKQQYLILSRE